MSDPIGPKFWHHKKRGTTYERIGSAEVQASAPIKEGCVVTLYRDERGKIWARPIDEFYDGRFEAIPE